MSVNLFCFTFYRYVCFTRVWWSIYITNCNYLIRLWSLWLYCYTSCILILKLRFNETSDMHWKYFRLHICQTYKWNDECVFRIPKVPTDIVHKTTVKERNLGGKMNILSFSKHLEYSRYDEVYDDILRRSQNILIIPTKKLSTFFLDFYRRIKNAVQSSILYWSLNWQFSWTPHEKNMTDAERLNVYYIYYHTDKSILNKYLYNIKYLFRKSPITIIFLEIDH